MDAASPDAFVEFAKSNPILVGKRIIEFISSERTRDERGVISAGTINNWVRAARLIKYFCVNISLSVRTGRVLY